MNEREKREIGVLSKRSLIARMMQGHAKRIFAVPSQRPQAYYSGMYYKSKSLRPTPRPLPSSIITSANPPDGGEMR